MYQNVDTEHSVDRSFPRAEKTQIAAVDALLASINPAIMPVDKLNATLSRTLDMLASLQSPAVGVRKAYYEGLTKAFNRIRKEGASIDFDFTNLKRILFGPDEVTEALRNSRADAIKAMEASSQMLASKLSAEI